MSRQVTHKNKFRHHWYTKLCDPTLHVEVNVAHFWKQVDCKRCLKLRSKRGKGKS